MNCLSIMLLIQFIFNIGQVNAMKKDLFELHFKQFTPRLPKKPRIQAAAQKIVLDTIVEESEEEFKDNPIPIKERRKRQLAYS